MGKNKSKKIRKPRFVEDFWSNWEISERDDKRGFYLKYYLKDNKIRTVTDSKDRESVRLKAIEIMQKAKMGEVFVEGADTTFSKFAEIYLESKEINNKFQSSSFRAVKQTIMRIFKNCDFKNKKMRQITESDIKAYFQKAAKNYADNTVKKDLQVLRDFFQEAKNKKVITNVDFIKEFKLEKYLQDTKKESVAIPYNLRDSYLEAIKNGSPLYKMFFTLLFFSGLRFGEAVALTPADVIKEEKENYTVYKINVDKQIQSSWKLEEDQETLKFIGYLYKNKIIRRRLRKEDSLEIEAKILKPKSLDGTRVVIIPENLYNELIEYINKTEQQRKKFREIANLDLIFINRELGHFKNNTANEQLEKLCIKANLEKKTCHDLRRTAITNWEILGMSQLLIQKLAGHSKFNTTRIYVNLDQDFIERKENFDLITNNSPQN